jgi:hypothetical protein
VRGPPRPRSTVGRTCTARPVATHRSSGGGTRPPSTFVLKSSLPAGRFLLLAKKNRRRVIYSFTRFFPRPRSPRPSPHLLLLTYLTRLCIYRNLHTAHAAHARRTRGDIPFPTCNHVLLLYMCNLRRNVAGAEGRCICMYATGPAPLVHALSSIRSRPGHTHGTPRAHRPRTRRSSCRRRPTRRG